MVLFSPERSGYSVYHCLRAVSAQDRNQLLFIKVIFYDSLNWTALFVRLFFDISDRSAHSHPADVSNEMHFSPRIKIMLSLCDRSCTSSTNAPGGLNPFGSGAGLLLLPPQG